MIDKNQYQGLTEALKLKSTLQQIEGGVFKSEDLGSKISATSFQPIELYQKYKKEVSVPGPPTRRSRALFTEKGLPFAQNKIKSENSMLLTDESTAKGDVMEFRDGRNESVFGVVQEIEKRTGKIIMRSLSYDEVERLLKSNPDLNIRLLTDAHTRPVNFIDELVTKSWLTDTENNVVLKYLIGLWLPKIDADDASVEDYIMAYGKILLWFLILGFVVYELVQFL